MESLGGRVYMASKTKHAPKWRALRASGVDIISTWIDEAGEGETKSFEDLWQRCISEASSASALILYVEEGEVMKGALVEVGAALAKGRPVFVVGAPYNPTRGTGWGFTNHPLVTKCLSITDALREVEKHPGCWPDR